MSHHGTDDTAHDHNGFKPGAVYEVTMLLNGVLMRSSPMPGAQARQMLAEHSTHFSHMIMHATDVDVARVKLEDDVNTCQDLALHLRRLTQCAPEHFRNNERIYWGAADRLKAWLDDLA